MAVTAKAITILFRDHATLSRPLAAWRSDTHFVTAMHLRSQLPIPLDLRYALANLCGSWQAVTFMRWQLTPHGTPDNETVGFFISKEPIETALKADC